MAADPTLPNFLRRPMTFLDLIWHLSNFAAPALLLSAIGAAGAKLLWRRQLRATMTWPRLFGSAAAASLTASVAGLVATGHDGKMLTFAAMVLACAISLWWTTRRR